MPTAVDVGETSEDRACDPKLMPSFPQHRNLKAKHPPPPSETQPLLDQTSQLPAISDILGSLVKKRKLE